MADEKQVTTHTVESHEVEKPKRTRKPRKAKAAPSDAQVPDEGNDAEIEIEESEDDHELGDHYVNHDGALITLKGDVLLRVMTPEQQKANGIKFVAGEMGKKCKKAPLVITFKNAKAATEFFNNCLNAKEKDKDEEFIVDGSKVDWLSASMTVMM